MTGDLDPAKLREAGRAALAELDAKQEVISGLQGVIDDQWREAHAIEGRIKAILVRLGLMAETGRFDENAAVLALQPGPAGQLDRAADILASLAAPGPDGQAARDAVRLLRGHAARISGRPAPGRDPGPDGAADTGRRP